MNKNIALVSASLSLLFSSSTIAEGFNDNYLQLGYSTSNYKFIDSTTSVSGSAELGNNFSILGSYAYKEGEWKDPGETEKLKVDGYSFGVGKSFNIYSNTDITSSLMRVDYKTKQTCTKDNGVDCTSSYSDGGTTKSNYYTASIGIINLSESGLEASLKYTAWRAGKLKPKSNEIELGLMKHINKNFAIGGSVLSHTNNEDWTEYGIFVRRSF